MAFRFAKNFPVTPSISGAVARKTMVSAPISGVTNMIGFISRAKNPIMQLEVRAHDAGVHRVRGDAGAGESSRELEGKKHVGELGLTVRIDRIVVALPAEIIEIDPAAALDLGRDDDDPRRRAGAQSIEEQRRQQERREMIHRELCLDAVNRHGPLAGDDGGATDEDIDPRFRGEHFGRHPPHVVERRQIADDASRAAGADRVQRGDGLAAPALGPRQDDQAGSLRDQIGRRGAADSGRRARHHTRLAVECTHLHIAGAGASCRMSRRLS